MSGPVVDPVGINLFGNLRPGDQVSFVYPDGRIFTSTVTEVKAIYGQQAHEAHEAVAPPPGRWRRVVNLMLRRHPDPPVNHSYLPLDTVAVTVEPSAAEPATVADVAKRLSAANAALTELLKDVY